MLVSIINDGVEIYYCSLAIALLECGILTIKPVILGEIPMPTDIPVQVISIVSNTEKFLRARINLEQNFRAELKHAVMLNGLDNLKKSLLPEKSKYAQEIFKYVLELLKDCKILKDESVNTTPELIQLLRLELQRRWLIYLIDFTIFQIHTKMQSVSKDVLKLIVLPEFYFTDISDVIDYTTAYTEHAGSIYVECFCKPFDKQVVDEFKDGKLLTMCHGPIFAYNFESLATQNVVIFAGTIIFTENTPDPAKKKFHNAMPIFANRRCELFWYKQIYPDTDPIPDECKPIIDTIKLGDYDGKSGSFRNSLRPIEPRQSSALRVPFSYIYNGTHLITFGLDICADFFSLVCKKMCTGNLFDIHVVVAAGAERHHFDPYYQCSRQLLIICDNITSINTAYTHVVNVQTQKRLYIKQYKGTDLEICWISDHFIITVDN